MIEPVARIKIEIEGTDPMIWRLVDVPMSSTLLALHDIIQVVMRWHDFHRFEFEVGDRVYGNPDPDDHIEERRVCKSKSIRLATLIERGISQFSYVYDFGDNWQLGITVKNVRQGDADTEYPSFVAGARRAPPEDVGGTTGFEEFLQAVTDPEHEEHARVLQWCGGAYDPDDIDEPHVRMILGDFAARRRGPLMSHRGNSRGGHT